MILGIILSYSILIFQKEWWARGDFQKERVSLYSFELPANGTPQRACRVIPYRAGVTQAELRMFLSPH